MAAKDKIIFALDVANADEAAKWVSVLKGRVGFFKIGLELFTAAGPDVVGMVKEAGIKVFLDLKFHDIPNTVAKAGIEAARLGVSIFNVHALGGSQMLRTTAETVAEWAAREGAPRPLILGVTVLTSHTQDSLRELGIERPLAEQVVHLAQLCDRAGLDGVVASPQEIAPIRAAVQNPSFAILTPGVRPAGAALNDQARVMTPGEAIETGATWLVVGRPIIAAPDPAQAAQKIVEEIEQALT